jgi:hypothetical protein
MAFKWSQLGVAVSQLAAEDAGRDRDLFLCHAAPNRGYILGNPGIFNAILALMEWRANKLFSHFLFLRGAHSSGIIGNKP